MVVVLAWQEAAHNPEHDLLTRMQTSLLRAIVPSSMLYRGEQRREYNYAVDSKRETYRIPSSLVDWFSCLVPLFLRVVLSGSRTLTTISHDTNNCRQRHAMYVIAVHPTEHEQQQYTMYRMISSKP